MRKKEKVLIVGVWIVWSLILSLNAKGEESISTFQGSCLGSLSFSAPMNSLNLEESKVGFGWGLKGATINPAALGKIHRVEFSTTYNLEKNWQGSRRFFLDERKTRPFAFPSNFSLSQSGGIQSFIAGLRAGSLVLAFGYLGNEALNLHLTLNGAGQQAISYHTNYFLTSTEVPGLPSEAKIPIQVLLEGNLNYRGSGALDLNLSRRPFYLALAGSRGPWSFGIACKPFMIDGSIVANLTVAGQGELEGKVTSLNEDWKVNLTTKVSTDLNSQELLRLQGQGQMSASGFSLMAGALLRTERVGLGISLEKVTPLSLFTQGRLSFRYPNDFPQIETISPTDISVDTANRRIEGQTELKLTEISLGEGQIRQAFIYEIPAGLLLRAGAGVKLFPCLSFALAAGGSVGRQQNGLEHRFSSFELEMKPSRYFSIQSGLNSDWLNYSSMPLLPTAYFNNGVMIARGKVAFVFCPFSGLEVQLGAVGDSRTAAASFLEGFSMMSFSGIRRLAVYTGGIYLHF
ncbi:MAG: hypothetical protein AB1393_09135 [Candidatus Edwardsbacteria bacterium]